MHKKNLFAGYRIGFALLGFSAIVTEIATLHERNRFTPANFFSFFTVESNLFAIAILLLSALVHARPGKLVPLLRGASTLTMIIVGIVFTLLLSGIEGAEFTAVPWDNMVLHYILPIVIATDWFMDIPRFPIPFKTALVWLLFPAAYLTYSLVRGHFVGWYPYPFLNPSQHGYAGVLATSAALLLGSLGLVWLLTWSTIKGHGPKV